VRTYVTLDGRPGVYFFSLDAASPLAVIAARRTHRLPYFQAQMMVRRRHQTVSYRSHRVDRDAGPAELELTYWPLGEPVQYRSRDAGALSHRALLPLHPRPAPAGPAREHPSPAMARARGDR
jgi:uncharacterized protein YqjF (DUF2071 family)